MAYMSEQTIDEIFMSHTIDEIQVEKMHEIRDAAKNLFAVILKNAPQCADRSSALRKIREACFDANAAIAMKGLI